MTKNKKEMIENPDNVKFDIKHPRLYKKYFGWCCETKWLLPKEECLKILLLKNAPDLIISLARTN